MKCDLLIRCGYLVPEPGTGTVIRNGAIAVTGNRIVAVGPGQQLSHFEAEREIEGGSMAAIPGLVNSHTHLASCIFRGMLDEGVAGLGLYRIAFPTEKHFEPDDMYWLGMLGAIEVLKAGCTTVNDIYFYASSLGQALSEIGLRAVLAEKIFDVDLPRIGDGDYTRYPEAGRRRLDANLDLIDRWHGAEDGRITCRIGTHATDTCSPDLLRSAFREAEQANVGLHIHVAQSMVEVDYVRQTYNRTPIEHLDAAGVLSPRCLCIHCTMNTDEDIDRMKRSGAVYGHTPTIYPRRGRYPRVWEFLRKGVPTGYGTDWIRMDPWEGMRLSLSVSRVINKDPEMLPAATLLHLYTGAAAEALGLEGIGVLAPGKKADIALLRVDKPHIQPFWGTIPNLVYNVNAQDVDTVLVDGRVLLQGGRCQTVDEDAVMEQVRQRLPRWQGWLAAAPGEGNPVSVAREEMRSGIIVAEGNKQRNQIGPS